MKRTILKSIILTMTVGILFFAGTTLTAYADDPSMHPNYPNKSHIHIKGRVTTPDGVGIGGAKLTVQGSGDLLQGLPPGCLATWVTKFAVGGTTFPDGSYEMIFYINTDPPCREAFDRITIDKTKMIWTKEGYEIKPH
jgi:hypothetical protein